MSPPGRPRRWFDLSARWTLIRPPQTSLVLSTAVRIPAKHLLLASTHAPPTFVQTASTRFSRIYLFGELPLLVLLGPRLRNGR